MNIPSNLEDQTNSIGTTEKTNNTTTSQPSTEPQEDQLDVFFDALEEFQPSIPPSLINHYLSKSGLATTDKKTINLIALATQKFLSDICSDAHHFLPQDRKKDKGKFVLRGEYLEKCLENYGVDIRRKRFFVEKNTEDNSS